MKSWSDELSSAVKIATDILFAKNPVGTSLGVFSGIAFHGLLGLFNPVLGALTWISISKFDWYYSVASFVVIFNINSYLGRSKVDPIYEQKVRFIETQVQSGAISKQRAKELYEALIAEAVASRQTAQ